MIRHVLTPSVSFSAAPDYGAPFFGYYGQYEYADPKTGEQRTRRYSMFPNALFGVPSEGKQGTVSFNLANNLEMKVKSSNDSIGEKKISLIENLSISQSYNMAADSLRWSDINASILLRLTKGFNLNPSPLPEAMRSLLTRTGAPASLRA